MSRGDLLVSASEPLSTQLPLAFDAYRGNRATGAFILIDESTYHTAAGGMIS